MNLLEKYKNRMAVAESVYKKSNNRPMDMNRKLIIAKALENTEKFLNEAFENSTGTQRADMGMYKKFALNLINVALPSLIAPELVIVHAMDSMSGYVTYLNYVAGTNKGQTHQNDVFNGVFGLGNVDPEYTSARVTESFVTGQTTLAWSPVLPGMFKDANGNVLGDIKVIKAADGSVVYGTFASDAARQAGTLASMTFKDGTGTTATYTIVANDKLAYVYDNQVIPQNDLPILNAKLEAIPLVAKARRIAIYYSQIAAFQAKQDYGFDLGDQLAEKAVGQLRYEIDTEICDGLIAAAPTDITLSWSKALPIGVSKAEHYEGFAEIVEQAKQVVYDRTKRFVPNYMLIASNILPILTFMKGFQAAPVSSINGPYLAGTLNGMKVFVTPNIVPGKFVVGVNGDDMMSSAAVYATYMPIVPTQLLQYADGGTSQGFSTLYDFKILNANLLVAGQVTDTVTSSGIVTTVEG